MSLYEDRLEMGIPQPSPLHLGDQPLHLRHGGLTQSVGQLGKEIINELRGVGERCPG